MNTLLCGDALTLLRTLSNESVQCCVTSPPYWRLRSYLPGNHPKKSFEIGQEDTAECYVEKLVEVFHEVRRVLCNDGVLWLNLADTYVEKQLQGLPWRVALALQADGWCLRSDVVWNKPNSIPDSVEDRPTQSHEYLFLLTKMKQYSYHADSVREPHQTGDRGLGNTWQTRKANGSPTRYGLQSEAQSHDYMGKHPLGRNKRSIWSVNTIAYPEAHFATFPPKLVEPCVLAGSRENDVILDPFLGSGTVALVALQHGRRYLGIELNEEYITLAKKRIATVQPVLWSEGTEGIA